MFQRLASSTVVLLDVNLYTLLCLTNCYAILMVLKWVKEGTTWSNNNTNKKTLLTKFAFWSFTGVSNVCYSEMQLPFYCRLDTKWSNGASASLMAIKEAKMIGYLRDEITNSKMKIGSPEEHNSLPWSPMLELVYKRTWHEIVTFNNIASIFQ